MNSKKTIRLENLIVKTAIPTSLIEATNILRRMGIKTSKSSISELLKKNRAHY